MTKQNRFSQASAACSRHQKHRSETTVLVVLLLVDILAAGIVFVSILSREFDTQTPAPPARGCEQQHFIQALVFVFIVVFAEIVCFAMRSRHGKCEVQAAATAARGGKVEKSTEMAILVGVAFIRFELVVLVLRARLSEQRACGQLAAAMRALREQ
ncbi:MAG TPA: hypothetical protein VN154_06355 [Rhizomicrobium sp.]|nr:hypothetical protein [Rhizomicrobium sp.]